MVRSNGKKRVINYENSIKKSNQLSMAKLSHGLTLNQMQLLAFAIYSTQQDAKTEFIKADFEKKFNLKRYQTEYAYEDSEKIMGLKVSTEDLENKRFKFWNVFSSMEYDKGTFKFKWNDEFVPHILELKEKYVTTDLAITSQFKSEFSWILYDFLRAYYGYWRKSISKTAIMKLFGVENRKTYQNNTSDFKRAVLNVAIEELNKYTELEVWYTDQKKGRAIVGFDLYWTTGEKVAGATKKQIDELNSILDAIHDHMFDYINLKNDENRQIAIDLVRETESMKMYTKEPISIQKSFADKLLVDARWTLQELERLKQVDDRPNVFYNWLEDERKD